ncbi:MAG TPA: ABC transporter permease [Candidatus Bathyarchaeia archaeon]|nr:ABC transporter permease [Candidatus Bathyarchaeia archaeon]
MKLPELTYRVWKVWRRNWDVFMKTYKVNFFPPLLQPILYLVALGLGLGSIVETIPGFRSYVEFIAPALIAMSMMNASFFECTYGSFVRMYYQKTFDAIITTPISIEEVIAGELLWGATRSLIDSSIVLGVVAAFGLIGSQLFIMIPIIAFLAGLLFSGMAMCFTAIASNIDFFNYPSFLFITPMMLICGTFFPLTILPRSIQIAANLFLPLTHAVILSRELMIGNLNPFAILSLIWLVVVTSIFFILSIGLMKRKLIK